MYRFPGMVSVSALSRQVLKNMVHVYVYICIECSQGQYSSQRACPLLPSEGRKKEGSLAYLGFDEGFLAVAIDQGFENFILSVLEGRRAPLSWRGCPRRRRRGAGGGDGSGWALHTNNTKQERDSISTWRLSASSLR